MIAGGIRMPKIITKSTKMPAIIPGGAGMPKIHLHIIYYADVIIYRAILLSDGKDILQDDLKKLVEWATTWLMSLSLNK